MGRGRGENHWMDPKLPEAYATSKPPKPQLPEDPKTLFLQGHQASDRTLWAVTATRTLLTVGANDGAEPP